MWTTSAKLFQSCPTLWDPRDHSLPRSSVLEIPQESILECVVIIFSSEELHLPFNERLYYFPSICVFPPQCIDITIDILAESLKRLIFERAMHIYTFLLLLLSLFSHVWFCATPWMAAHQVSPPWDSPGKNSGVGCHCLLQCMKMKSESEVTQSCLTRGNPMDCSLPGSSIHGIFQTKSTGVGCHCLLQNIRSYSECLFSNIIFRDIWSSFKNIPLVFLFELLWILGLPSEMGHFYYISSFLG